MRFILALISGVSSIIFYLGYNSVQIGRAGQILSATQEYLATISPLTLGITVFAALAAVMPNDRR
jgi:hypothetical protein